MCLCALAGRRASERRSDHVRTKRRRSSDRPTDGRNNMFVLIYSRRRSETSRAPPRAPGRVRVLR